MNYQLAQLNLAKCRLPILHPANKDFVNNLDQVNAVADAHPGFVWRLKGEGNSATELIAFDDPSIITNLSVWEDLDSLSDFVYRSEAHKAIMQRRREWFDKMELYLVLWWVPAGHEPDVAEAQARLELLAVRGPTPDAFTFQQSFPAPE